MTELVRRTGRPMHIVEYSGHPRPNGCSVLMGSGGEAAAETVAALIARGERVGVLQVRLYRPFPTRRAARALPPTVRAVGVLDRTKEPGSFGEPLYLDVVAALAEAYTSGARSSLPMVCGGRYGLSSKEFTPAMVAGVFAELARERPRTRFTVGIDDDVSGTSIDYDAGLRHRIRPTRSRDVLRHGLGRNRRRQQEHDQDPRRRGEPLRPGLLRLRLQKVRLADRFASAVRARTDPRALPGAAGRLRRLSPRTVPAQARRAGPRRRGRRAVAQQQARPRRSGTPCRSACNGRSSTSTSGCTSSTPAQSHAR